MRGKMRIPSVRSIEESLSRFESAFGYLPKSSFDKYTYGYRDAIKELHYLKGWLAALKDMEEKVYVAQQAKECHTAGQVESE